MLRSVDGWENEHFAFADAELSSVAAPSVVAVDNGPDGPTATIPDAHLLFTAQFSRAGADLVLQGEDGKTFAVHDYFATDARARLLSPEGAALSPDVVAALAGPLAPGQFAQAGAPQANAQAVGRVAQVEGGATIVRNGVAIQANTGDAILKGDVLQTVTGSLGVTFNDGSTLNITANSRLVVNEFVYDPRGSANSQLLDLVQGSLTFISGEIAHTGDMRIGTPVATMGIRGTVGGVTTANDGTVRFYVSQSATGAVILDSRGTIIANVVQDGPLIVVRPVGPLQVLAEELQKSPAQLATELAALQHIVSIKSVGDQLIQQFFQQNPTNPNPQSTDTPHTQIPATQIELKPSVPAGNGSGNDGNAPPATAIITRPPPPATPGAPPVNPDPIIIPIPVNLPPINFGPLNGTTDEDQALTFTGQTAISVFDVDTGVLKVTLSATHGILTLSGIAGLTFSAGGNGAAAMTFSGTQAAINAALNGATFRPAQDYNGPAAVTVTVSDGVSPSLSGTIVIAVAAVNDAPVIVGSSTVDLPQINEAGQSGGLEPDAGLQAQIDASPAVLSALSGLLTAPAGVIAALATVRAELNVDTATAMAVVWDYLDDLYVSALPNQIINVDQAFVRLGVEYAKYVKAGGAPLVDVTVKFTADGGDAGTAPDRQQSLHDNLLGNLGSGPVQGRFGTNPGLRDELTALITGVDPDLLMRPFYSGNEGASPAAVRAWDLANGFAPAVFTENGVPAVINAALTLSDVDSATLAGATVTIAGGFDSAQDVLAFTAQGNITGSYNAQTGVLTLSGEASLADYQAVLRSVTYQNTSDNPSGDARTIEFQVNDGASQHSASNVVAVTVNVTPVNDAPVIVGSSTVDLPQINEAGQSGGLEPDAGLQAQIAGSAAVQGALTGLLTTPAGVVAALATVRGELNVDTATAITAVWDYLDDIYVSASPNQIINVNEAFVRLGIEYAKYLRAGGAPLVDITAKFTADGADQGTAPDRQQSLHDNLLGNLGSGPLQGRFGSNPALRDELTVLITGVDPDLLTRPFHSGNETATAAAAAVQAWDLANGFAPAVFTENGSPAVVNPALTLSDVDSTTLAGATVRIAGNFQSGDVLDFTAQGNITGTYNAQTGILTLSGVASLTDYQAALRSVTYQNTSEDPSGAPRTIAFQVSDGASQHSASNVVAVTVNVTPVNDAPVIVGSSTVDLPYIEAAGPGGGLEPEAGLNAAAAGNAIVQSALTGLLTVPAGVITVALATVRSELNIDTATAMVVVWDYLDDIYVSAGPNQANVNEAFTRLGIEYALYLKNGGAPLVDITAKFTADGADANTLPDRQQSLHDNFLGNLGQGALQQRYGNNPTLLAELTALINAVDPALLTRPYNEGTNPQTAATVAAWDIANGYTPAATGMLVATDVENNATLTWSATTTAGTYGTFAVDSVSGVWTYTLNNNLPATQALAQGETATETFTATVTDEHGATDTIVVTVTATGTNDAPVIVGSVAVDLLLIEGAGSGGNLEPDAALNAQIGGNAAVTAALSGLLTVPAGVISVALATVRSELSIDTATAMVVVWDYLDDIYVSAGPNQANVNEAFTRLGIEYAKYLKDGGTPLVDITAKFVADGGDANTLPDRQQSLHDNFLGNLGVGALQQRYGNNPTLLAELTALINDVDSALLTRPYNEGTNPQTAATVAAWDIANGYTPAATGMLVATDADHGATLTWSVNTTAGTYGTFAVDAVSGVWTYKPNNNLPATQQLAQGETATEIFTVTVNDEHGATDTMALTITVTGSSDAPVAIGSEAVDLPLIEAAGPGGGLEPEAGLNAQIADNTIVMAALTVLLTVPGGVTAALATVRTELNLDDVTAMTVVWDFLDDRYVSHGPNEIEINEAFVRLGAEYATYLKAGGAPLTAITAKYTADGNSNGTPDREQSLHDNLLGNLGAGPLQGRFGSNPTLLDELTNLIEGVDANLLTRPFYSGNESATAAAAAVQAWDAAHGYTPAAAGMLVATDADSNATLTWSVTTTAGTYGNFALNPTTGMWTYWLDNDLLATQRLAQGETATETFTATVTDEHGATDTMVVYLVVIGTDGTPVVGGNGDDVMLASAAADTFVFAPDSGRDTVVGFDTANDIIDISEFGISNTDTCALQAFLDSGVDHGNGLVFTDGTDSLFLQGVSEITLANLHGATTFT